MKVYERIVLNWDGEVLEETSFEYEGDVAWCGGGSKGSSSSSSSKVDYPSYMKDRHSSWMSQIAARLPGTNPYPANTVPGVTELTGATAITTLASYLSSRGSEIRAMAYSPTVREPAVLQSLFEFMLEHIEYILSYMGGVLNVSEITQLDANIAQLNNRLTTLNNIGDLEGVLDLNTVVFPRFEAGMRDINAVQMSTFVIGRGVIEATYQAKMQDIKHNLINDIEKTRSTVLSSIAQIQMTARKANIEFKSTLLNLSNATLQLAANSGSSLDTVRMEIDKFLANVQLEIKKMQTTNLQQVDTLNDALAGKDIELRRLKVVAVQEQFQNKMEHLDKQYRWELENYQYGANMLAAIGGGTAAAGTKGTSKAASAIGGALSGAAAGAMIGGPVGAGIGGALGLAASFF